MNGGGERRRDRDREREGGEGKNERGRDRRRKRGLGKDKDRRISKIIGVTTGQGHALKKQATSECLLCYFASAHDPCHRC